ncbi:hypothetical protein [uncultured Sphingobium sp.]|uniref:hypothetical protein n=1 Tax=uncultured Sphingobium sp. TaxID=316087 RepID=UPI00259AEF7E|nr:hypothetical protein [uncultured Sphingobium sp.]
MDQTLPTIRIARPGTFTSNEGVAVSFSEAMLAASAAAYDRSSDPAPLVIGHPQLDHPAYGWVDRLDVQDGELVAIPATDIEPSFAEAVRSRRYAKVSARFYAPDSPANPKPGSWYLKHIGFLGAHAPGIKGLGTVQFSQGDDQGVATFDFSTTEDHMSNEASFAERMSALDARETVLAAKEEAARIAAAAAIHLGNVSFAEGLIAATTLAPAAKDMVVGVLDHLDANAVVSFGEAGEMSPAAALKKLLSTGAPLIDLTERGKKPKDDKSYVSFAAPEGYDVDPEQADLHARAKAIQQENAGLSWIDAVKRAQAAG